MIRDKIHAAVTSRVDQILDFMAMTNTTGNVSVNYHRDKNGVKKVVISHEETWVVEESGDNR